MAVSYKYTLLCDEVRQENNGKFIVIGLYMNNIITVPQLPFVIPSLTFYVFLESDRPGTFPMRLKLEHLETGKELANGMGAVQFAAPGTGSYPIRIGNVQLIGAGGYTFSLNIEDGKEPVIVNFSVVLRIPTPQQPSGGH